MFSPTSPVTGGPQTGFTSPTYTIVADMAPDVNGKQYAVTALGGTQAGVTIHSASSPFTVTLVRPKVQRGLPPLNPVTGNLPSVPKNVWTLIARKGMVPLAGQATVTEVIRCEFSVPAGADLASPAEIRAALSLLIGTAWQQSAALGDSFVSGLA